MQLWMRMCVFDRKTEKATNKNMGPPELPGERNLIQIELPSPNIHLKGRGLQH